MPWSPAFLAKLSAPTSKPKLTLTRYLWNNTPGQNTRIARSSWGVGGVIGLSPSAGVSFASQSIGVPTWTSNRGSLRIGFGGVGQSQWVVSEVPRGAICQLSVDFETGVSERVWRGRVTSHNGVGPQHIVSAYDLVAAASSRSAFIGADESELFYHCTEDSTHTAALTALWTAGSSTVLTFGSPPQHERETGKDGAVLVTPASGADPFILTYTGKSGNELTGVSTAGQFGTTATNAAAGSTVQEVCWIEDSPPNVAAKILTSTGAGTNGVHDTLPASWGFAMPAALLDAPGISRAIIAISPTSGSHSVRIVSTTAQPQGLAWLQSVLQRYGVWLTMRQAQITARVAIDRWATVPTAVLTLGPNQILRALPARSIYDASSTLEYGLVKTVYSSGFRSSGGTLPKTRPAKQIYLQDFGYEVYQNQTNIADRINERLAAWYTRVPTVVDLQTTLVCAQLCPGDWIVIAHLGLWTQTNPGAGPDYAMVGAISVDWQAGVVSLRLYIQHPPGES